MRVVEFLRLLSVIGEDNSSVVWNRWRSISRNDQAGLNLVAKYFVRSTGYRVEL
jgi:hypothetical protein